LKIIHIISKHSRIQGGSYTVALNLANAMGKRGHDAIIVSQSNEFNYVQTIRQQHCLEYVMPSILLIGSLDPSTLLPFKGFLKSVRFVRSADIVHIHLGREVFGMLFAGLSIAFRKRFVIQTHGMIVTDSRNIVRLLDVFIFSKMFKKAKAVLCLTENEINRIPFKRSRFKLFPNGIEVDCGDDLQPEKVNEIIFLGRINEIKRLEKWVNFVSSLNSANQSALPSVIYGFDGGALNQLQKELEGDIHSKITYAGGLIGEGQVKAVLRSSKVLLLTSKYENFPMAVVEAMSVGTPVLIFDHFDIAPLLKRRFPEMVITEANQTEIPSRLIYLTEKSLESGYVKSIIDFAKTQFSIQELCNLLETSIYG